MSNLALPYVFERTYIVVKITTEELAAAAKLLNIRSSADGMVVSEKVIGFALALVQAHVQQAKGGRLARITTSDQSYRLSKNGWVGGKAHPVWPDLADALNWVINASQCDTTVVRIDDWHAVRTGYLYMILAVNAPVVSEQAA